MIFLILFIALCSCLFTLLSYSIRRPKNYPPGPAFVPYTGNTIQLRKESKMLGGQHLVFEKWSKEYNTNVLGLKLQNQLVIVVLSYPLVHSVQTEEVFEGRPNNFFIRLRTMGTRKGITCTDGSLWFHHRHWAMKEMRNLGYGRFQMQKHIQEEARSLIQHIESKKGDPVWPGSFLALSVINVLWTFTAGKRFERNDRRLLRLLELMDNRSKVFDMSGGVLSQFPWLRFIIPERTGYNIIQQLNKEFYNFFMETIEEHKTNLNCDNEDNESDFIFSYLKEMKNQKLNNASDHLFNETQLIMTILDFFIAGSQTTSNTLDIAIMNLALREKFQNQLYEEIKRNSKEDTEAKQTSSRVSHPLTNAFLMEIQRYFQVVPISGPRRTLKKTTLDGYDIPENTTVLISLRSVHMDKKHWGDPEIFRPERFIDELGNLRNDEYFMPFGQGRRRCLGDALARACMFNFIVEIVKNFQIQLCDCEKPSLVLQPGITLSAKPYKIQFIKRT